MTSSGLQVLHGLLHGCPHSGLFAFGATLPGKQAQAKRASSLEGPDTSAQLKLAVSSISSDAAVALDAPERTKLCRTTKISGVREPQIIAADDPRINSSLRTVGNRALIRVYRCTCVCVYMYVWLSAKANDAWAVGLLRTSMNPSRDQASKQANNPKSTLSSGRIPVS